MFPACIPILVVTSAISSMANRRSRIGARRPRATVTAPSPTVTRETPSHETTAPHRISNPKTPKTSWSGHGAPKCTVAQTTPSQIVRNTLRPTDGPALRAAGKTISVPRRLRVTLTREVAG